MKGNLKIIWSAPAKRSLLEIMDYIKNRDSLSKARYVRDEIIKTVENTAIFPLKHPIDTIINNSDIRFTLKWSYKIVFRITKNSIQILEIFHTRQNPDNLKNTVSTNEND